MKITADTIEALRTGFNTDFNNGFTGAETFWKKVAMVTKSSSRSNTYGWLGQFPRIREWIGDRVLNNISEHGFKLENKDYESSIVLAANDIRDDNIGIYGPMVREMGKDAAEQPDKLSAQLIDTSFVSAAYDGQNFFDREHPVAAGPGQNRSVANVTIEAGYTGPPWYLIDGSRAVAPFIYQEREPYSFQGVTDPDDAFVWMKDKFAFGVRGRSVAGFGFWQLAHGAFATLNEANYVTARTAMTTMRGDMDRILGIKPTVLLVPSELEKAGRNLIAKANLAGGESNIWAGTVELVVSPWLSPNPRRPI